MNHNAGFHFYDDGRVQYLYRTLSNDRFVVVTDLDGMAFPTSDEFMACVYTSENAFNDGEYPLACADSTQFATINMALDTIENVN
jgi:hypothetical protein